MPHRFLPFALAAAFIGGFVSDASSQLRIHTQLLQSKEKKSGTTYSPFKAKPNATFAITTRFFSDEAGTAQLLDITGQPWEETLNVTVRGKEVVASNTPGGSIVVPVALVGEIDLPIGATKPLPAGLEDSTAYFTTQVTSIKSNGKETVYAQTPAPILGKSAAAGPQGPPGVDGINGSDGTDGADGMDGEDGASPFGLSGGDAFYNGKVGVGISGDVPTSDKLYVNGNASVTGQLKADDKDVAVGEERLRILRGTINSGANGVNGSGWTALRQNVGEYEIQFNPPFAGAPTFTGTCGPSQWDNFIGITAISSSEVTLRLIDNDDQTNLQDSDFHFIAIGSR